MLCTSKSNNENVLHQGAHKVHAAMHNLFNKDGECNHLALDQGATKMVIRLDQKNYKRYVSLVWAVVTYVGLLYKHQAVKRQKGGWRLYGLTPKAGTRLAPSHRGEKT